MKWAIIILAILMACTPVAQEATTKPIMAEQIEQPKVEQVLEPEIKAPQEVIVEQKEVEETPVETPKLSPEEECTMNCEENCKATAQNACTQKGRPECKQICSDNPIIDPSACTQACTYVENQPNACKVRMEEWCTAQCVKSCV